MSRVWLGMVKGSPPLGTHSSAWPPASLKSSEVGTHQMEEQRSDPACMLGYRQNPWGWTGAKSRAASRWAAGAEAAAGPGGSWCGREGSAGGHAGFWASTWHTLGWGKPCKPQAPPADKSCNRRQPWAFFCSPPLLGTCCRGTSGAGAGEGGVDTGPARPARLRARREREGSGWDEAERGLVRRQSNSGPGTIKRDLFLGSGLSLLWGTEWKMYI